MNISHLEQLVSTHSCFFNKLDLFYIFNNLNLIETKNLIR